MDFYKFSPSNWFKPQEDIRAKTWPGQYPDSLLDSREALHKELDRLLNDFFRPFPAARQSSLFGAQARTEPKKAKPNLDFKASAAEYQISIQWPDLADEDIFFEVDDGALLISGGKRQAEGVQAPFHSRLALPADADADNITADFKPGLLRLSIPRTGKKPEEIHPDQR